MDKETFEFPLIPEDISGEDLKELIAIINRNISVCNNFVKIDNYENMKLGLKGDYGFHIDTEQFEYFIHMDIMRFSLKISKPHCSKLFE